MDTHRCFVGIPIFDLYHSLQKSLTENFLLRKTKGVERTDTRLNLYLKYRGHRSNLILVESGEVTSSCSIFFRLSDYILLFG